MKLIRLSFLIILFFFITFIVLADGNHGGFPAAKKRKFKVIDDQQISSRVTEKEINGRLVDKKYIDGYEIKIKVVDVKDSISDGGTHNLLVKIERDARVQQKISVNAKVVYPDGSLKSRTLFELGDWYLAGYDLGQKGKYQITISFKTADGINHRSDEIYYP